MARTKQTARNSTGAPAPRKSLAALCDAETADEGREIPLVVVAQPKHNLTDNHNNFCSGCNDGGEKLYLCSTEGCSKVGCETCFSPGGPVPRVSDYVCPTCHQSLARKFKLKLGYDQPYVGFVLPSDPSKPAVPKFTAVKYHTRSVFPNLNTTSLALVSIYLDSMDTRGTPFAVVSEYLYAHFSGDTRATHQLLHFRLVFNFSSKKTIETYTKAVRKLILDLQNSGVARTVVFFTTHSTPDTGLLHHVPGNRGAATVEEVLSIAIPAPLRRALALMNATLFMLVCGGIFSQKQSWDGFEALAKSGAFRNILAFPTRAFQPHQAITFCQAFVERVYIEEQNVPHSLMNILQDNPRIGVHSDVLLLCQEPNMSLRRFVWVHHVRRPFGIRTPLQCPSCGVLETVKVSEVNIAPGKRIRHRCLAKLQGPGGDVVRCGWVKDIDVPAAVAGLGRGAKSVEGEWVVVEDANPEDLYNTQ